MVEIAWPAAALDWVELVGAVCGIAALAIHATYLVWRVALRPRPRARFASARGSVLRNSLRGAELRIFKPRRSRTIAVRAEHWSDSYTGTFHLVFARLRGFNRNTLAVVDPAQLGKPAWKDFEAAAGPFDSSVVEVVIPYQQFEYVEVSDDEDPQTGQPDFIEPRDSFHYVSIVAESDNGRTREFRIALDVPNDDRPPWEDEAWRSPNSWLVRRFTPEWRRSERLYKTSTGLAEDKRKRRWRPSWLSRKPPAGPGADAKR